MSDGTLNLPERLSHPSAPATGRVLRYIFNDGAGTREPYFMLDDGIPRTMVGDDGVDGADGADGIDGATGPTGPQGIQGIQGIQGEIGPVGPMNVEGAIFRNTTVTLPNSTAKTVVYTDTITHTATGACYLNISLAHRPHNASNDAEYDISYDRVILTPEYVEEHKDTSAAQSNWRSYTFDLGTQTAGNKTILLRFSKESAGGTAQIKGYTAMVVRYA